MSGREGHGESGDSTAESRSRLGTGLALLGVSFFVVAYWWQRVATAGAGLPVGAHDLLNYYLPLYDATFTWIASGRLPQWNASHLAGIPWLATMQAGVFYPPHVLYLLLPTGTALAISNVLHLCLAGLGTVWLLRLVGVSASAAAVGGVLFATCGLNLNWLRYPSALEAGAWVPIACTGALYLARGGHLRGACVLALAIGASLLAGYPQATTLAVVTAASLPVALLSAERAGVVRWGTTAGWGAGAVALGAALAGVQLLPSVELTGEANRALESLELQHIVGRPSKEFGFLAGMAAGEVSTVGVACLLLAPLGLAHARHRALAVWGLLLGVVGYSLASAATPWLRDIYAALPVLNWFRSPTWLLLPCQFGLAVAAALGLDALQSPPGRYASQRTTAIAGSVLATALAVSLATRDAPEPAMIAAVMATACAVLAIGGRRSSLATLTALVVAVALDVGWNRDQPVRPAYWQAAASESDAFLKDLAGKLGGDRATTLYVRPFPPLKRAALLDLRWLDDYEPLTLRRQAEYFGFLRHGSLEPRPGWHFSGLILPGGNRANLLRLHRRPWAEQPPSKALVRKRLLDLAATRALVTSPRLPLDREVTRWLARHGLEPGFSPGAPFAVYANRDALPRAFVTYTALPAPPAERLLALLSRPSFDPLVASYVEASTELPSATESATGVARRGHPARITQDEATVVEVEADLEAPGLVVLADTFASGWRAFIDGEAAPILAANHLFRGVRVPSGHHTIRFTYRTPGLAAGAVLSAVAAGGLAALAWAARQRSLRAR